jgi:hypothetical protein
MTDTAAGGGEQFDFEQSRYSCFVVGCPGNHPSKREVCASQSVPLTPALKAAMLAGADALYGCRSIELPDGIKDQDEAHAHATELELAAHGE